MVSTKESKKKEKEEKRKKSISGQRDVKRTAKKSERLELAQARAGAGQEHKLKDKEIVSTTGQERREKEITAIAQKGLDIETEKKRIQAGPIEGPIEEPIQETPIQPKTFENIETETIIQTDELGMQREFEVPIGTSEKIRASEAAREGRVPFDKLPAYQQFLAGAATTSVSPALLTKAGKPLNLMTSNLSKLMKTTLGKYIGAGITGSGIITWLASDNIIGTMGIYGRDLAEDVKWGTTSKEAALEKFDEGRAFIEEARNFIRGATALNPLLWPFRKIILINVDAAELAMEENRQRILRA